MLFVMAFAVNLTAQNLTGKRVYIDPGHDGFGSNDRNVATINFNTNTNGNGFYESVANVDKGLELRRLLQAKGATVGMTRTTTPEPVALAARPAMANAFNADAYVSIHSNAHDGMVNHPLALWDDRSNPIHPQTQKLALDMVWWIADNPLTSWSSSSRTNARAGQFGAVLTNQMAAALTEDTFHDYRPETHRYLSLSYNHMISFNHLRGILRFFNINPELHPTGIIIGWVKDDTRSITPNFPVNGSRYIPFNTQTSQVVPFRSHDAYWPINQR
jgi:N-acetylmuramoyl-L-alanine amidase